MNHFLLLNLWLLSFPPPLWLWWIGTVGISLFCKSRCTWFFWLFKSFYGAPFAMWWVFICMWIFVCPMSMNGPLWVHICVYVCASVWVCECACVCKCVWCLSQCVCVCCLSQLLPTLFTGAGSLARTWSIRKSGYQFAIRLLWWGCTRTTCLPDFADWSQALRKGRKCFTEPAYQFLMHF